MLDQLRADLEAVKAERDRIWGKLDAFKFRLHEILINSGDEDWPPEVFGQAVNDLYNDLVGDNPPEVVRGTIREDHISRDRWLDRDDGKYHLDGFNIDEPVLIIRLPRKETP